MKKLLFLIRTRTAPIARFLRSLYDGRSRDLTGLFHAQAQSLLRNLSVALSNCWFCRCIWKGLFPLAACQVLPVDFSTDDVNAH